MDKRNIESNNAVMCIETYMCRPVMLTFFLILFITLGILGAVLTGLLPDQYIEKTYSTQLCPEGTTEYDTSCTGVDILHNISESAIFAADETGVKYNKLLFGQPVSSHEHVGVSFPLEFELTTILGLKESTKTVRGNFMCAPYQSCNRVLLLRYSGYNYGVHIKVKGEEEKLENIGKWVGDFELVTRYDNMKFEKITIIWRYISCFFCVVMFIVFIINILRVEKKSTPEQKNAIVLLIGTILYDNPLYLFNIFYRGSFWSVVDEIFSMIGVCTMMLYPLLSLGGFITSKISCSFYLPRYLIVGLYFVCQLVVEVYVAVQSRLDPDSEVFDRPVVRYFSGISLLIFLIWVIYFIYNLQRCVIVTKQHPKAIKGRYRVFLLWIALISIAFHLIQIFTYIYRNSYRGSFELVRSWLASILAVSIAILLSPTTAPRMTSTTLTGAMHPKAKPTPRSEATTAALADVREEAKPEPVTSDSKDDYNVDYEGGFTGDVAEDRSW